MRRSKPPAERAGRITRRSGHGARPCDDRANANRSFQIAVTADPDNVQVRLGLARVAADENPPIAREMLDRILQTNPNYVPAHLLIAEIALGNRRRDEARVSIRRALGINPQSLEAIALEAGIAALEGRTSDFDARVAEIDDCMAALEHDDRAACLTSPRTEPGGRRK